MFDWLKNIFGGGNKTSSTPSRPSAPRTDPAAEQRKREEEERRKREAEAKRQADLAQARRDSELAAKRRADEDAFNVRMQKMKTPEQKQKELDQLTQDNLGEARAQEQKQRGGIFDDIADMMAGGAREKRAQVAARNRATTQYQEKYGWDNDKDVISYGNRTLEKAKSNSKDAQNAIENTKKTVDVIRYLPGAGLGELGANAIRGNFSGSQESDDTLLREQMDLTPAQIKALSPEDRSKYLAVSKGGLAAGVLDVVGLGAGSFAKSAAKGGVKNAIKNTAKSSVKQVVKDIATKQGAKTLVKNAAIGAGGGGAIGYGGAKLLGADDEAALQAGVRSAAGGAFGGVASSPFDIATTSLAKTKPAKNAVRGALEKGDATTVVDAATKTAQRVAGEDAPTIPNMTPVDPVADNSNKIEVAPGVSVEQKQESTRGKQPIDVNDNTPAFVRKREAEARQAEIDAQTTPATPEVNDIPAFQRQGKVLSSEVADQARAAELETILKGVPTSEQLRSTEFNLRAKFAKDVQARPDLRFQLQTRLNQNLQSLKSSVAQGDEAARELGDIQTRLGDAQQQRKMAQALDSETAPAVNTIDIPDVSNPIALAKGDEMPMAEFSNAITAPLPKADVAPEGLPETPPAIAPTTADIADAAAQGDLRLNTRTDADAVISGTQPLRSDADVQRELAEAGIAPNRGDSPVAMAAEAEEAARAADVTREVSGQTNAPLTREAAVNRVTDEEIRDDLMQNAPRKETVNLEDAQNAAKEYLNRMDDPEIMTRFSDGVRVDDPTSFYTALNAIKRLERINTPEAQQGIRNAIDSMAEYAAESGRGLRTVQVLFDDMPAAMKVDYLTRKLSKAGADLTDNDRAQLAGFIQQADNATAQVRALEDRARTLLEDGSITNGNITPELQAQVRQLSEAIQKATLEKEAVSGQAFRDYQRHLDGEVPFGKKAGDVGRTLMLSAPSGRIFDVISTTSTAADDMLTRGVSNLIGKGVNAVTGAGNVQDTFANPRQLAKGVAEGARRIGRSFKGDDFVEDFLGEAKRSTRGDINTGGGIVRRTVRSLVETPTNLTRGLRNDQLYREGMQEAAKQGLTGDARKAYAELRALVPTSKQLDAAVDAQMRANMLHENGASRMLNSLARSLDSNKALGGWLAPLIRNQIAPFTSWLGGNLNRTFTDKNVLYNASHALVEAKRGNVQGVIDDVSKLAVNSAQAYAVGALLTQAGIITTEDANGDDYAGLYFHIGDRYIPVAAAGTVAVPIILGNAFEQASREAAEDGSGASAFANALVVNTLKNAGVASVFGGENNLQSTVAALAKGQADVADTGVKFVGDFVRQYIPSLTGDVNAFLNMTDLNPTGEAAQTKVLTANPDDNANKQDPMATEWAKTLNRIPFASQGLARDEGKLAQDPIDRMFKGSRENDAMVSEREKTQSLADMKAQYEKDGIPTTAEDIKAYAESGEYDLAIQGAEYRLAELEAKKNVPESMKQKLRDQITEYGLEKEGVPTTKDGIQAATESGNWDGGIKGFQYQLSKIEDDKNVPESDKQQLRDGIKKLEITRDGQFSPEVVALYASTSATEWRAAGNPESEDYNPELYEMLNAYDEALTKGGVSGSDKGKDKRKYTPKSGGGGGGGGGRGGKNAIITSIATNDQNFSVKALQKAEANSTPKSAIPEVELVKNYDTSKLKKIKVSKGAQR